MPLISKPNYNQIFASQAPDQDKPAVFNNYPEGWGVESRPNNGKPTIKGFNYLQQTSDLKDLWILQNGACLPYDESIEYADGAPVLKDGVIQYKTADGFKSRDAVTIPTYSSAADGVDPVTGVAEGAYYNVRSTDDDSYLVEYQNIGGVPTPSGKSYPSSSALLQVKNGLASISELIAIQNPEDGDRHFVKGLQGGWFEYNLSKSGINDGGTVFNGWSRYTLETITKPEWFGSPRNGTNDDAEGIRKAIAYLKNNGGGRLFFTKDTNKYQMKSVDVNNSAFTLDSSDITLEFETDDTDLIAQITMGSICYIEESIYNLNIIGGRFLGNGLATFCLNTNPLKYSPLISITRTAFRSAIDVCLSLQTYVGNLTGVKTFGGKTGIKIRAVSGNIVTSLTLSSCYTNSYTEVGYDIAFACYCSLISCASDNSPNGIAYKLNMRGGAMIGCGAENVKQPIQFVSFRGVSIQGFYCQRVGTKDPLNPQPHLIEFVTGTNATLSGLLIEAQTGYYYDKRVAITQPNYGSECLTVTDDSVRRNQMSFVTNFEFGTRPIKLLIGDATQKNVTVTISTVAELQDYIKVYLTEYRLDHTLTIQLANGTYNFGTIVSTLNKLYGAGEVIIQGNSSDRTLVKIETQYNRLIINGCSAKVRLKNLTLSANSSNNSNERLIVDSSPHVFLDNVLISRNELNTGVGVRAINGSCVYLTNGTAADSSSFAQGIFVKDATSKFILDASDTIPTTSNWSQGMKVENSNPVTNMGWVFSGGAWKVYGAIT